MNFAIPITDESVHHFYGWTFWHCTALPVGISDDELICVKNTNNSARKVQITAWGSSGGPAHAKQRDNANAAEATRSRMRKRRSASRRGRNASEGSQEISQIMAAMEELEE